MPFCHLRFSAARGPERRYERIKVADETLGGALRNLRWEKKLEQADVASNLQVSKDTYRHWETNKRLPSHRHKRRLEVWLRS